MLLSILKNLGTNAIYLLIFSFLFFWVSFLQLFPYHLAEYVCRVMRVSPFRYYCDMIFEVMKNGNRLLSFNKCNMTLQIYETVIVVKLSVTCIYGEILLCLISCNLLVNHLSNNDCFVAYLLLHYLINALLLVTKSLIEPTFRGAEVLALLAYCV